MKIGKKSRSPTSENHLVLAVSGLLLVLVALFLSGGSLRSWINIDNRFAFNSTDNGELATLVIDMPFENYDQLLDQRAEALESAVFIADNSDFLNADIRFGEDTVPVKLRLKQGVANHLGGDDKWNFELHTRRDEQLLGMSRFFLIDPADHNWLDEWTFMEALRLEGIITPRYRFVRLIFNGDDRGIYALQEGFGPELATAQSRQEGVVVGFDTTKLWEMIGQMGGEAAAEANPITNLTADSYSLFSIDTLYDVEQEDQQDAAIDLLSSLQDGSLPAREIFDIEQMGMFLALADLWGAADGAQLTNLRFFYNPRTGRLEPIGFNGSPKMDDNAQRIPISAMYGDAQIQAAYVAAAEQIAQPDYLERLRADLETDWEVQARLVNSEVNLTPPWEALSDRQQLLNRSLNPTEPVLASLGAKSLSMEGVIGVDVANIVNLPIELVGFDVNGELFLPADPAWWTNRPAAYQTGPIILASFLAIGDESVSASHSATFQIPLTTIIIQNNEFDFNQQVTISVVTRLVGQENTVLTEAR